MGVMRDATQWPCWDLATKRPYRLRVHSEKEDISILRGESVVGQESPRVICIRKGLCTNLERYCLAILSFIYSDLIVIKSFDCAVAEKCDYALATGGLFEPESNKFDTKLESVTHYYPMTRCDTKVSMCPAGWLWKQHGERIIESFNASESEISPDTMKAVCTEVYDSVIMSVDAFFSGVTMCPCKEKLFQGVTGYAMRCTLREHGSPEESLKQSIDEARMIISLLIDNYLNVTAPIKDIMVEAYKKRFEAHPSGQVLLFDMAIPWRNCVHQMEQDLGIVKGSGNEVLWAVHPGYKGEYRATAVSEKDVQFANRCYFPESYRGLRDSELNAVAGIDDAIFVHHSGFTGGAKSLKSVLKMVTAAIEEKKSIESGLKVTTEEKSNPK